MKQSFQKSKGFQNEKGYHLNCWQSSVLSHWRTTYKIRRCGAWLLVGRKYPSRFDCSSLQPSEKLYRKANIRSENAHRERTNDRMYASMDGRMNVQLLNVRQVQKTVDLTTHFVVRQVTTKVILLTIKKRK